MSCRRREVDYDPRTKALVANPVQELVNLRNGTVYNSSVTTAGLGATADGAAAATSSEGAWGQLHVPGGGVPLELNGTAGGAAASADIVLLLKVPKPNSAADEPIDAAATGAATNTSLSVCVLSDAGGNSGIAVTINVSTPTPAVLPRRGPTSTRTSSNTSTATHSIASLSIGQCGEAGRAPHGHTAASMVLFDDEDLIDVRILVDRSIVEAFVMGGSTYTRMCGGWPCSCLFL